MSKIDDALKNNQHGLHYGNRLFLPFPVDILKVSVEGDLIMDFSTSSEGAEYSIHDDYTEIYFHNYKSLEEVVTKYEVIKMVVVEKGKNLFDFKTHRILNVDILENHKTEIKEIDDDQIFVE